MKLGGKLAGVLVNDLRDYQFGGAIIQGLGSPHVE